MKEHFCPVEQSTITYQGKCNWCGQKEWVGLTDEEVMKCLDQVYGVNVRFDAFAKVIEAKLKEKNSGI